MAAESSDDAGFSSIEDDADAGATDWSLMVGAVFTLVGFIALYFGLGAVMGAYLAGSAGAAAVMGDIFDPSPYPLAYLIWVGQFLAVLGVLLLAQSPQVREVVADV